MAPRASATSAGSATCSLQVRWWYPSRSASIATRAISSMPAVSSHWACARGSRVTAGVTMPSFTSAEWVYLRGSRARSAMMFFCTSVAPAPIVV